MVAVSAVILLDAMNIDKFKRIGHTTVTVVVTGGMLVIVIGVPPGMAAARTEKANKAYRMAVWTRENIMRN